jgi:hypothetical protein
MFIIEPSLIILCRIDEDSPLPFRKFDFEQILRQRCKEKLHDKYCFKKFWSAEKRTTVMLNKVKFELYPGNDILAGGQKKSRYS